jgi:molybdopterin-guanine dinucleotide biosynthesis protein A
MNVSPLYGLVLAGGASTRMHRDKAALDYHGKPQVSWAWELLNGVTGKAFVSMRPDQVSDPLRAGMPQVIDRVADTGPIAGILAALMEHPDAAWLVIACDLPFLNQQALEFLVSKRDPVRVATAYRSSHDGLPEPLCAIYEAHSRPRIEQYLGTGKNCPRKFLLQSDALILEQPDPKWLDNVNTPEELSEAQRALRRVRRTSGAA